MKNVYLRTLVPLLVFAAMQAVSGILLASVGVSTTTLSIAVMLSGLFTILVLWKIGMVQFSWQMLQHPNRMGWKASIVSAFTCIIAVDLLSELLRLPDIMAEQFMDMAHNWWGIVAIAVVGPVVEELVFREAILGHLLRSGVDKWSAIVLSALLFGIIHGNPIQIPFAIALGLIFGLIYYRMRNVVLTSIIHIINNSIAVAEMNFLADESGNIQYYDYLGLGTEVGIIVVCGLICIIATRKIDE